MDVMSSTSVIEATETGARDATSWNRTIRMIDLVIAVAALTMFLPVLLLAMLAIRISSPGPALFRQRRLGLNGKAFTVFKLRTMRADAPETRHRDYVRELISCDPRNQEDREELFKLVVDDRVTRVGRLLRTTSLDEIPQLLNVIRGQMSLVGPRPVIPYEAEIYPPWYNERFDVKPGLTGLWQVSGRNRRTYEEMVELDIDYVRTRSLGLYLRILASTIPTVLVRRRDTA